MIEQQSWLSVSLQFGPATAGAQGLMYQREKQQPSRDVSHSRTAPGRLSGNWLEAADDGKEIPWPIRYFGQRS